MKKFINIWSLLIVMSILILLPHFSVAAHGEKAEKKQAELAGRESGYTLTWNDNKGRFICKKNGSKLNNGWSFDSSKKIAYCTGKNGYLYAKIKDGKYYTYTANNKKPSSKVFKNKKNTIIRLHKKNFYVGANGLINLNKGWKLNNNGLYTYYVEKNGTVSVKISNGKFRVWNGKDIRWDKKDLKNYKGKVYTYNEKSFFVNTNGNISRAMGWQESYFIDNDGCVKYYDDGTTSFRITKNGGTKALKDGWNDDVYVKNGKIQRSTIVKSGGCNYFVDKNGSRQNFKVKNNQIVRPDNSMAVSSGIYAAAGKKYPIDNKGKIQKNSTVFIKNKAYETVSDGSLSKQPANHVHLWKAGSVTEQIDHKAKTKEVQIPVKEWDEEVWSEKEKYICKKCGKYYDTLDEWEEHSGNTNHGNYEPAKVLLYTIHHPTADEPKYENTTVVTEKAWSEWYQIYTCRDCGEKMRVRVIDGKPTKGDYDGLMIPSKKGRILNAYGEKKMTVSACMAFPASIYNGKQITSEQSLSKYGFCYLGEERKSYNILLPDTYLQLLKDHNIQ
ncbi:cell wall-binding repeat protein [Clostridium sp. CAG:264]|nr:cell wall-binding repeat protein [Clostridium sp. CAG:264]